MVTPTPPPGSVPKSGLVFVTRALRKSGAISHPAPQPSAVTVNAPPDPSAAPKTLTDRPVVDAAPPRLTARLVVVRGERPDASYRLLDGKNYVGRTADLAVDIDLDGQESVERTWVSRRHAVFLMDASGVVVEDLHSLNGTFVNRSRLHAGQRKPLKPGDVVQLGTVQLKLVVE